MQQRFPIIILLLSLTNLLCLGQSDDAFHKKKIDSLVLVTGSLWDDNIDSAQTIANYMLQYSEENNFLRGIGQAHGTLASILSYKGDEGTSLWHSQQALSAFEKTGNQILINKIRLNLGLSFYEEGEYEEALAHTQKAYDYFSKQGKSKAYLVSTYISLGLIKNHLNTSFEEQDTLLSRAITMSRDIKDTLYLCNALSLRAELFVDYDFELEEAKKMANESEKLLQNLEYKDYLLLGYNADVMSKLFIKENKLSGALAQNDSALKNYTEHQYLMGIKRSYENRVDIFSKLGDFKKAYETQQLLNKYSDSLATKRRESKFNRLKIEYETNRALADKERAETEAKVLALENKKKQIYLFVVILVSVVVILLSLAYLNRLKNQKKTNELTAKLKALDLEKSQTDSELKALKSQMNPHFIFNALNSVQDYIIGNHKNEASEYLGRFADLIRRYLSQSDLEYISLEEEVESLEIYMSLEALRFDEGLDYRISLSEEIEDNEYYIPTMLIQPFVENAITHGLLHKLGKRTLTISFSKESDNTILCIIEDNGIGREVQESAQSNRTKKHISFSTRAIQERLKLFNKNSENKFRFEIIDIKNGIEETGTKVIVNIPIINIHESNNHR